MKLNQHYEFPNDIKTSNTTIELPEVRFNPTTSLKSTCFSNHLVSETY